MRTVIIRGIVAALLGGVMGTSPVSAARRPVSDRDQQSSAIAPSTSGGTLSQNGGADRPESDRSMSAVPPSPVDGSGRRSDADDDGQRLSDADLRSYRAGAATVTGNQTMTATTVGNVLNGNYAAGAVTFSDKSLSNFNGLGNFAINTGAQVSLQSALNLTINVAQ